MFPVHFSTGAMTGACFLAFVAVAAVWAGDAGAQSASPAPRGSLEFLSQISLHFEAN